MIVLGLENSQRIISTVYQEPETVLKKKSVLKRKKTEGMLTTLSLESMKLGV